MDGEIDGITAEYQVWRMFARRREGYTFVVSDDPRTVSDDPRTGTPEDTGLRRMMTWLLIALVATLIAAYVGVELAIHFFDRP
jgi:hypothetical protein